MTEQIDKEATESPSRVLTGRQITRATSVVAVAFILSGVLGLIRAAVIGGQFGSNATALDAFTAANRIPELLFTLVAGGALGSAFIPIYARFVAKGDREGAARLASAQLTLVLLLATVLAIAAGIFCPWITSHILLPYTNDADKIAQTLYLTRVMLATVVIFSGSGLVMGILNANQHFLTPALAPSMYNLGLIIGAVFLAPMWGITGVAVGAVIGAMLHLGIQLPALRKLAIGLRPLPDFRVPGVIEVFSLMGPRVLGSAVVQINFLVNTALASSMINGSIFMLSTAFALMFTVLGVLGQSVGTAVFPTLSALYAQQDMDGFRHTLAGAMRSVLFMSIPATIGMIVLARPLVDTVFHHGTWTSDETTGVAWALRFYAIGLSAFALQEVLARAFYALHDTLTPVIIGTGGMVLNVVLSLILMHTIQGADPAQGPFGGLALANALATMIETVALWWMLRKRAAGLEDRETLGASFRVLLASLAMGAIVFLAAHFTATLPALLILLAGTAIGAAIFEIAALGLGIPEARSVPQTVLRRFIRRA